MVWQNGLEANEYHVEWIFLNHGFKKYGCNVKFQPPSIILHHFFLNKSDEYFSVFFFPK